MKITSWQSSKNYMEITLIKRSFNRGHFYGKCYECSREINHTDEFFFIHISYIGNGNRQYVVCNSCIVKLLNITSELSYKIQRK